MEDTLVQYNTAKLAKEKGFSEECHFCKNIYNTKAIYNASKYNWNLHKVNYSIPTQSLLQKWIREKHNIHVEAWFDNTQKDGFPYLYEIYNQNNKESDAHGNYFNTYEEALEQGLFKALLLI